MLLNHFMKKIIIKIVAVFVLIALVLGIAIQFSFAKDQNKLYEAKTFEISELVANADVELGKRLFTVRNGCIDCHGEDLAGARVMDNGAMGTIYGANLTPFNLSTWTDEEIARAIRYGIHKTGRSLRFMPSFDFEGLSLGDTAALVAYLRSAAPVERQNFVNIYGPVAKTMSFLGQMPVMFPAKILDLNKGFGEKPEEGPTKAFGQYLAHSCVGCHGHEFRGGKIPGGDPSWPEASNIRLGMNPLWTEESFTQLIKTGVSPISSQPLRLPMPIAQLQQMNEVEIKALWSFLSTLE